MRRILFLLTLCILAAFAGSAVAQTPDGETPANEGVCDELIGATPGLYGLCVAFCEAQDHASVSDPITEEELEILADSAPAGRILTNYNRKKTAADPDMPCIKVEEPCPCWDSAEFEDALVARQFGNCHRWNGPIHNGAYIQNYDNPPFDYRIVYAVEHQHGGTYGNFPQCFYQCQGPECNISRFFNVTLEEFEACEAQVRAAQTELGLACSDSS